jgi:hypothetical protein
MVLAGRVRRRCLARLAGAGQRQAGDDGIVEGSARLRQAPTRGVEHRAEAFLQADADVGRAGRALAEDSAGLIGEARAAPGAPAVNPKEKYLLAHLHASALVAYLWADARKSKSSR